MKRSSFEISVATPCHNSLYTDYATQQKCPVEEAITNLAFLTVLQNTTFESAEYKTFRLVSTSFHKNIESKENGVFLKINNRIAESITNLLMPLEEDMDVEGVDSKERHNLTESLGNIQKELVNYDHNSISRYYKIENILSDFVPRYILYCKSVNRYPENSKPDDFNQIDMARSNLLSLYYSDPERNFIDEKIELFKQIGWEEGVRMIYSILSKQRLTEAFGDLLHASADVIENWSEIPEWIKKCIKVVAYLESTLFTPLLEIPAIMVDHLLLKALKIWCNSEQKPEKNVIFMITETLNRFPIYKDSNELLFTNFISFLMDNIDSKKGKILQFLDLFSLEVKNRFFRECFLYISQRLENIEQFQYEEEFPSLAVWRTIFENYNSAGITDKQLLAPFIKAGFKNPSWFCDLMNRKGFEDFSSLLISVIKADPEYINSLYLHEALGNEMTAEDPDAQFDMFNKMLELEVEDRLHS